MIGTLYPQLGSPADYSQAIRGELVNMPGELEKRAVSVRAWILSSVDGSRPEPENVVQTISEGLVPVVVTFPGPRGRKRVRRQGVARVRWGRVIGLVWKGGK